MWKPAYIKMMRTDPSIIQYYYFKRMNTTFLTTLIFLTILAILTNLTKGVRNRAWSGWCALTSHRHTPSNLEASPSHPTVCWVHKPVLLTFNMHYMCMLQNLLCSIIFKRDQRIDLARLVVEAATPLGSTTILHTSITANPSRSAVYVVDETLIRYTSLQLQQVFDPRRGPKEGGRHWSATIIRFGRVKSRVPLEQPERDTHTTTTMSSTS
jgi:hypothetical protein